MMFVKRANFYPTLLTVQSLRPEKEPELSQALSVFLTTTLPVFPLVVALDFAR